MNERQNDEGAGDFSRNHARDRLSDWAIYALEQAGREDEIIPLCEAEARRTSSYLRLVERLVAAGRFQDAEQWITEGLQASRERWPGIAGGLRHKLLEIRVLEKNWPAVAAIQAEEFVRGPSRETFTECKKAAGRIKAWPQVRRCLLDYLERRAAQQADELAASGNQPGRARNGTKRPVPHGGPAHRHCHSGKKARPGAALVRPASQNRLGWRGVDDDEIAEAVQTHAPDRAVAIWKKKAEGLIARVQPSAYQQAAKYLRKAAPVMVRQKKRNSGTITCGG